MSYRQLKSRVDELAAFDLFPKTTHSFMQETILVLHLTHEEITEAEEATVLRVYSIWRMIFSQDIRYLMEYTNYHERCFYMPEQEARFNCMYLRFPRGVPFNRSLHGARQTRYSINRYTTTGMKLHLRNLREHLLSILARGLQPAPQLLWALFRPRQT